MRKKIEKIPVSERALVQRINRRLKKEWQVLKKSRGWRMLHECGEYYLIDIQINGIIGKHIDIEEYGHKLGVLNDWEILENEQ